MVGRATAISSHKIASDDAGEVSDFIAEALAPCMVQPLNSGAAVSYCARYVTGDSFFVARGCYGDGLEIQPLGEVDMVMVHLGLRGEGTVEATRPAVIGTEDTIVISAGRTLKRLTFAAGNEEIVIGVGAESVRTRMSEYVGFDVHTPFDFQITVDARTPLGSALHGFGSTLHWAMAMDTQLQHSPIELRRCKDAFIDLTLSAMGMDAIRGLAGAPQKASLSQVKKAEAFMRASGHAPIGVSDVANHLGISVRALQYAFRRHRGCTPLAVLQQVRIEGFRDDLRKRSNDTIARIAARWGFSNLGRLGKQYRETFGERPSDTVFRAHGRR